MKWKERKGLLKWQKNCNANTNVKANVFKWMSYKWLYCEGFTFSLNKLIQKYFFSSSGKCIPKWVDTHALICLQSIQTNTMRMRSLFPFFGYHYMCCDKLYCLFGLCTFQFTCPICLIFLCKHLYLSWIYFPGTGALPCSQTALVLLYTPFHPQYAQQEG